MEWLVSLSFHMLFKKVRLLRHCATTILSNLFQFPLSHCTFLPLMVGSYGEESPFPFPRNGKTMTEIEAFFFPFSFYFSLSAGVGGRTNHTYLLYTPRYFRSAGKVLRGNFTVIIFIFFCRPTHTPGKSPSSPTFEAALLSAIIPHKCCRRPRIQGLG